MRPWAGFESCQQVGRASPSLVWWADLNSEPQRGRKGIFCVIRFAEGRAAPVRGAVCLQGERVLVRGADNWRPGLGAHPASPVCCPRLLCLGATKAWLGAAGRGQGAPAGDGAVGRLLLPSLAALLPLLAAPGSSALRWLSLCASSRQAGLPVPPPARLAAHENAQMGAVGLAMAEQLRLRASGRSPGGAQVHSQGRSKCSRVR